MFCEQTVRTIYVGYSVEIILYWLVEERADLYDWTAMSCVLYDHGDLRKSEIVQDHAPLNEMKAFVLGMYVTWVTVPGKELGCTKSNCVSGLWYFGKHSTLHT